MISFILTTRPFSYIVASLSSYDTMLSSGTPFLITAWDSPNGDFVLKNVAFSSAHFSSLLLFFTPRPAVLSCARYCRTRQPAARAPQPSFYLLNVPRGSYCLVCMTNPPMHVLSETILYQKWALKSNALYRVRPRPGRPWCCYRLNS